MNICGIKKGDNRKSKKKTKNNDKKIRKSFNNYNFFFTFMSFMYKQETDGQNVYRINAHR